MTRLSRFPSAETIEQEARVLEMRRASKSPTEISRELGISLPTVKARLKSGLARTLKKPAAEYRAMEIERLEALYASWWERAQTDPAALDRVLKIHTSLVELLGLGHRHGVQDRILQLEADKVRLVAVALGRTLDALELDPVARSRAEAVLFEQLEAVESEVESEAESEAESETGAGGIMDAEVVDETEDAGDLDA